MTNNSQNPCEYDAVLGGNSLPPIDGAVLGGIERLKRRLETGNTHQKVESLTEALKYGDGGIDLLIDVLNDGEIEVRAKAFQLHFSTAELLLPLAYFIDKLKEK